MSVWNHIEKSPEYQSLDDERKQGIRRDYFTEFIVPDKDFGKLPEVERRGVYDKFVFQGQVPLENIPGTPITDFVAAQDRLGGQIKTGLEKIGMPTEIASERPIIPDMPLAAAHEVPVTPPEISPFDYPIEMQATHEPVPREPFRLPEINIPESMAPVFDMDPNLVRPEMADPNVKEVARDVLKLAPVLPSGLGFVGGLLAGSERGLRDKPTLEQRYEKGVGFASKIAEPFHKLEQAIATKTAEGEIEPTGMDIAFEQLLKLRDIAGAKVLKETGNPYLAAAAATFIEAAPILLPLIGRKMPGLFRRVKASTPYRQMTIKERGLVLQTLEETLAKNPNITEAQLARMYPEYFKQAHVKRMKTEKPIAEEPPITEKPVAEPVTPEPEFVVPKGKAPAELIESKRKLEILKQRYTENGIKSEIPKVEKAIKAIDDAMTEAPPEAEAAPVQVPPFPEHRAAQPAKPAEVAPEVEGVKEPTPKAKQPTPKEPWEMTENEYINDVISKRPSTPSRESNYNYMVKQIRKSYRKLIREHKQPTERPVVEPEVPKEALAEPTKPVEPEIVEPSEEVKVEDAAKDIDVGEGEPPSGQASVGKFEKTKMEPAEPEEPPLSGERRIRGVAEELEKKVGARAKEEATKGAVGFNVNKPKPTKEGFRFKNPETETRYQAAKKIPKDSLLNQTKMRLTGLRNKITREYEHLPKTGEFAQLRFGLLNLQKQKGISASKTIELIRGTVNDLNTRTEYDLFNRKLLLEDLMETGEEGKTLPFGYKDTGEVKADLDAVNKAIIGKEEIEIALKSRKEVMEAVRDDYIDAMKKIGFDVSKKLTRKAYFRHQVLEHAEGQTLFGTGGKLKTPRGRGFLKQRKGSEQDILSDFIQAEHEVLAQMLYDTDVAEVINTVRKNYDISDKLKQKAKKQEKNWKELIPKGYTDWQPAEGNVFYMADSIPAKLAKQLASGQLETLGLTAEDLKPILAIGGKRKQFIVKDEVAATLDGLVSNKSINVIATTHKDILVKWKQWQLVSPRRYPKYNFRNLTGDADAAFAGRPSVFKKVPAAYKDLAEVYISKKPMKGDLLEWFERGGMGGVLQAQEMGELKNLSVFKRFHEKRGLKEIPLAVWKGYWRKARLSTDFREALLRFAAYKQFKTEMQASKTGLPKDFAASIPEEIKGLADIKDRAYWMSNDLLGAYDRVGVFGHALREHVFPFWSWKEVNFRRYVRMARNAANDQRLISHIGKKTLGAAVIKTPYRAWKISRWLLRATAFLAALHAWNHLKFPEEEKELPKYARSKPHIIIGRDPDGTINYFTRVGALGDLLEWFGLDEVPEYTRRILDGKMTPKEAAVKMAKEPVNVFVQGAEPFVKVAGEALTRRSLFPDAFRPGVVRDRIYHVMRGVGLENEYKALAGKPSRGYKKSLKGFFMYSVDPGEAAYRDIVGEKYAYMRKIGKYGEGFWLTSKGNALYDAKLALRYGDEKSSEYYTNKYYDLGGTGIGLIKAYLNMDPLSGMSVEDQIDFTDNFLDDEDRERLVQAYKFYGDLVMTGLSKKEK